MLREEINLIETGKNTMTGFGSRAIHEMLNEAGVCNDLTVVPNGGHGIYRSKKDVDFRINRVACFFKSLICNTCVDFMAEESIPAVCGNWINFDILVFTKFYFLRNSFTNPLIMIVCDYEIYSLPAMEN